MKLDKAMLEKEVQQAEQTLDQFRQQVLFAQGGLSVLKQLLELANQPEVTECQPETP